MTLYDDLGVNASADSASIKKAFKRRASASHPDKKGGSTEAFQVVQKAYAVLSDETKRRRYDETGLESDAPNIISAAQTQLAQLFIQLIESKDPDTTPYIEQLNIICNQGKVAALQQQRAQETRIKKMCTARTRLGRRKKTGINFLALALEQQIKSANANLEAIKQNVLLGDEMLKMLEEYSYAAEAVPATPSLGSYFTFNTTTR